MKTKAMLLWGVLCAFFFGLTAQDRPIMLNDSVRYGTLENGFTYYILHNEEPKNRASFYIVQNLGAVLEEDDQNGLAHMLEHMAFNGTTHFPGKGIKDFLERNGVEFGKNFNAYTNVDETVYNISNVPTDNPVVLDSCVWILHDWSGSILLEDEEIDLERGVIKEEWRTRNGPGRRIYKQLAPYNYYQSKYAIRDVIGSMDVVENSDYRAIKDFYTKWYRPDLQAAVIVGDFDVDQMESSVKEILSKIPKPVNPAERIEYPVADNEGMLFAVATDKEASTTNFSYMFKHKPTAKDAKDEEYMKEQIKSGMIYSMMASRFQEILAQPDAAFLNAYASYYHYVRTLDLFNIGGTANEGEVMEAFEAVYTEVERARRHGFTAPELERVKAEKLKSYEYQYKTREKISNDRYASMLKVNYLENEPQKSIPWTYEFTQAYIPQITLEDLAGYYDQWIKDDNVVFTISGPEKEGLEYPTKADVQEVISKVKSKDIEPYVDSSAGLKLMNEDPKPGKVSKTKTITGLSGVKEYTLKNGAKVVLYPTDNTKSQIVFRAVSLGGKSLLETDELPTAMQFSSLVSKSGIGELSDTDLDKVLAGKSAWVNKWIGDYTENMSGSADSDDIETFMQLLYLTFTSPRFDEEAFKAHMERTRSYYVNRDKNPRSAFGDTLNIVLNNASPRRPLNDLETINSVSFDTFKKIYKERFGNIGDFTFFFVGDFQEEKMLTLVKKYIGGIKGEKARENWVDDGVSPPDQDVSRRFTFPMETAKYSNYIRFYNHDYEYSAYNNLSLQITASLLKKRFFETMREEEGGTYGAGASALYKKIPSPAMGINIQFDSNPDKGDKLIDIAKGEARRLVSEGAIPGDLAKVKESMIKGREQNLKNNWYLCGQLEDYYTTGINSLLRENYEDIIENITVEDYNKTISALASDGLLEYEIIMKPEESQK
ncbi:MAG: insulinase family protein [Cyclobacteriaceae bacterium]